MALDPAGTAVLNNFPRNVIQVAAARTGTFYGRAMTAGHIYTVAGNGSRGFSGIVIADTYDGLIRTVTG